jgi:protein ImuA
MERRSPDRPQPDDLDKAARRRELAARIRAIEAAAPAGSPAAGPDPCGDRPLPLGIATLDARLGGGIFPGSLHEISGPAEDGAASGFAAAVLAGFARHGPVVWIAARRARLHAPGLAALGLDPSRLLAIEAGARGERIWAFEEALRAGAAAAVLAEIDALDFKASRRLQLAAATRRAAAILLDRGPERSHASAARTRWRIATAPSLPRLNAPAAPQETRTAPEQATFGLGPGAPRWRVELRRTRQGSTGVWLIEQTSAGLRLTVDPPPGAHADISPAAPLPHHADRPSLPGALAAPAGVRQARAR